MNIPIELKAILKKNNKIFNKHCQSSCFKGFAYDFLAVWEYYDRMRLYTAVEMYKRTKEFYILVLDNYLSCDICGYGHHQCSDCLFIILQAAKHFFECRISIDWIPPLNFNLAISSLLDRANTRFLSCYDSHDHYLSCNIRENIAWPSEKWIYHQN